MTTTDRSRSGRSRTHPEPAASRHVLIYDGECELCRRSVRWLCARDGDHAIDAVPYQDAGVRKRFPALSRESLEAAMHLVAPDGQHWEGSRAAEELFLLLPGVGWVGWGFRVPGARSLAAVVYAWVARNRQRFGCGDHCAVEARHPSK